MVCAEIRVGLGDGFDFRKPRKCWFSGRIRLPNFQKLLALVSVSDAFLDGFDFGFGFVMFLRPAAASFHLSGILCLASSVQ